MHSSLAITTGGVPLGLAAVKFWTRDKFKGTNALKRHVNPTRVPIETKESYRWLENLRQSIDLLGAPQRCVHVGDRESDIYELYCFAQDLGTHFLVRVQTDRLAEPVEDQHHLNTQNSRQTAQKGQKAHRVFEQLESTPWAGTHEVALSGKEEDVARLQVKFATIKTLPPIGKQKHYHPQTITYVHAREEDAPSGREPINWKLATNLPVTDLAGAIEKLDWYALRWKIEVFHKVLKSGCRAEDAKLRTAERLVKFLALLTVVSWRVFWLTMSARATPCASPETVLTPAEINVLDQIDASRPKPRTTSKTLQAYILQIAMLGGYLARSKDPPPGNMVIWRGITRLNDIALGIHISEKRRCG